MNRFFRGFSYAFSGIVRCIKEERNFRFEICTALPVCFFARRYYVFTAEKWAVLLLVIFGVLASEMFNSAIERAVDKPDASHDAAAGFAKDMAAGAVLLRCAGAVAVGVLLFWNPDAFAAIRADFLSKGFPFLLLAGYLAVSFWFVFRKYED